MDRSIFNRGMMSTKTMVIVVVVLVVLAGAYYYFAGGDVEDTAVDETASVADAVMEDGESHEGGEAMESDDASMEKEE